MKSLVWQQLARQIYWTATFQRRSRLRERDIVDTLRDSGLFDSAYYAETYADVVEPDCDPLLDFVRRGAADLRNPNPLFDTSFYLERHPDVASSGLNPLLHFVRHGVAEGRDPNPLFDTAYYLEANPDVEEAGLNPLAHYLVHGAHEGRNPHPLFDTALYSAHHPEIADGGLNPLAHYLVHDANLPAGAVDGAPPEPSDDDDDVARSAPAPASPPKLIAFYLPQYHPIPENDEWWGPGFTEWTNVTRGQPQFENHRQPRLPGELGFYDLRVPDIRERQADLARQHGIHGFCFYYYWFNGRRVLERPLEEMLSSGSPDFPFCICWANENWTRRWDGLDDQILLRQSHSLAADARFLEDALPMFHDPRYIKVDGAPVLLVYRPDRLRHPAQSTALWKDMAEKAGFPDLHLCAVQFHIDDPRPLGFDAAVEFPPHHFPASWLNPSLVGAHPDFNGAVLDYCSGATNALRRLPPDYVLYRGIMPSWDNAARRGKWATVYRGASPESYEAWLTGLMEQAAARERPSNRFLFVNAWNEWAEGAHLEPDNHHGRAYLEATRRVVRRFDRSGSTSERCDGAKAIQIGAAQEIPTVPWKGAVPVSRRRDAQPLLFVSHDTASAGSQQVLLGLVTALAADSAIDPHIVTLEGGDLLGDFERVAPVFRVDEFSGSLDEALAAVVHELADRGLRSVFCNTVVTSRAAEVCKRLGLEVVALIHEQPDSINELFGGAKTVDRIERSADRIVAVSDFSRRALVEQFGFPAERVEVVRPPVRDLEATSVDRRQARAALGLREDVVVVLGCGTLYPRKGPDLFVEVAERLANAGCGFEFRFLWVGGPWEEGGVEAYRCLAEERGVSEIVSFEGLQEDVGTYFAAANVFALPSREDPFPLVNMEAMSFGLPVVAFADAGGAPELIGDDAGKVVDHLDVGAMADAVATLGRDAALRRRLGRRGREKVVGQFTPERYARALLAQLEGMPPSGG